MEKIYSQIIIGSGPAGYTAAIYSIRAGIKDILLISGDTPGGQIITSPMVDNYPGVIHISGAELTDNMEKQVKDLGGTIINDRVTSVDFNNNSLNSDSSRSNSSRSDSSRSNSSGNNVLKIITTKNQYQSKTVIIATGSSYRTLGIAGEKKYDTSGVSYCATCDGFFYKDKTVVVVGGGNTALMDALFLSNYAKKVIIVHRRDEFRGEKIAVDKIRKNPKIELKLSHVATQIIGKDSKVSGIVLKNLADDSLDTLDVQGVFIAIGHIPNSSAFADQLLLGDDKSITTTGSLNMKAKSNLNVISKKTKKPINSVFAAGDICDNQYKQAITAAAMGCMSALDASYYLNTID